MAGMRLNPLCIQRRHGRAFARSQLVKKVFWQAGGRGSISPAGRHISNFQFEMWQFRLCRNRRSTGFCVSGHPTDFR